MNNKKPPFLAVEGLADARTEIDLLSKTERAESFALGYSKTALENMEKGRQAVQEKVKLILPTIIVTLTAAASIAAFALGKADSPSVLRISLGYAMLVNVLGGICCFYLGRVLEATYDFYTAAIIHAAVVLKVPHPWVDLVDSYARKADKLPTDDGGETAEEKSVDEKLLPDARQIRDEWRNKLNPLAKFVTRPAHPYNESGLKRLWSRRLLEQWKNNPASLLVSYQNLVCWGIIGHFLCALSFIALMLFPPGGNQDGRSGKTIVSTNVVVRASVSEISSNLFIIQRQLDALKSNIDALH